MEAEKLLILIVSGYHPKETFAVSVGDYLIQNNSTPNVKVVKYKGKRDRETSTYNLRRFIESYDPLISPIILHDWSIPEQIYAVIVYRAKSKNEMRKALRPLLEFKNKCNVPIDTGRFLDYNTKYSLVDIELNSEMKSLPKAVDLIENFSRYLIELYLSKGVIL